MRNFIDAVISEFHSASHKHGAFASPHEGYAILLEEVEELWDEIKKKPEKRDMAKLREEGIQVAAMAMRFLDNCVDDVEKTPEEQEAEEQAQVDTFTHLGLNEEER